MPRLMPQYCPHLGYAIGGDAIWCEECFAERLHARTVVALEKANVLYLRELALRQEDAEWVEPRPQPRQTYVLPPQPVRRGGMNVEPE